MRKDFANYMVEGQIFVYNVWLLLDEVTQDYRRGDDIGLPDIIVGVDIKAIFGMR